MIEYRYISGIGIIAILLVLCGYATGRAASGHIAPVIADNVDSLMADEARTFLAKMPSGLQTVQEEAVRLAMKGDLESLNQVRSSRNTPADIPSGIEQLECHDGYRLYRPVEGGSEKLPVLVYLHGGGWCFGSINSCAAFCTAICDAAGIVVLALDYPLAPEHVYPVALDFISEALGWINKNADSYGLDNRCVFLGGDSAGGNLAIAAALKLIQAEDPDLRISCGSAHDTPAGLRGLLLFYPVVKAFGDNSDSWREFGNGYGLDSGIMEAFNQAYVGENSPYIPLISPYFASEKHLAVLPEMLVVNAGHDILCDQGEEFCIKVSGAGGRVTRCLFPEATHLFITVPGQPTAFAEAVRLSASFLSGIVARSREEHEQ